MACFPRIFPRKTQSFTPAEDENKDTLLDTRESSVQIGRYARREETPIFAAKSTELFKQQQQKQLTQQNLQTGQNSPQQSELNKNNNIASNHTNTSNKNNSNNNNANSKSNPNPNSNSNSISNNINSFGKSTTTNTTKKFISNKQANNSHQSNSFYKGSFSTKLLNANSNSISNNSSNNSNNSSNSTKSSSDGNNSYTFTSFAQNPHPKLKPVKQRRPTALPHEAPSKLETEAAARAGADAAGDATSLQNGYVSDTEDTTPEPQVAKFFIFANDESSLRDSLKSKEDPSDHNASASPKNAILMRQQSNESATEPKFKYSKNKMTCHCVAAQRKTKSEPSLDHYHIPIPPPLPPTPLVTLSPSASLISMKSAARKKQRKSKLAEESCRLECEERDVAKGMEPSSGIDNPSTPTDSLDGCKGSPQSRRAEGGLIHMRTNLPVQKEIEIEFIEKDEATRNLIRTAIENNDFLNNYMDKERKEMVIDAMEPASYVHDSFIINENDEGSEIFVSEEGTFEVYKAGKLVGTLGPATVFGELAILYNAKRFASIKAITYARVWKIDRDKFRNIMVISGSRERQENLNFLRSAPFLKDLSEEVLKRVVDLLQRKFYETNACIVREGEIGNEFFIIRGGTVTIKKKNEYDVERVVSRRKRGEYFGEQALLNADRRQASVYADPPGTEVLKLDREAFISYLGTIPQLREKPMEDELLLRQSNGKSEFNNEYANIELGELKKIATLGAGAFGRVDLVAYQEKTFALKIIKKIDIVKQDQIDHVYSEKHVMMKCSSSPFIIELYKTFRNDKFVYFLMEACMGGDVWTVMSQRRFFDEKTARFIAGCVVEAFDFLHSRNIIYRDLKPENLMLTTDGYCKLVDFGFAKHVPPHQKTNTFAGTPEYVAPEIILDRGHDRAVDYWALGILIFELLVGKTPFRGQNQIKIYQQILGGIDVIQMPSKIPKSAQGLIKHLCKQLPVERLGYQRKGIQDIKKHSWFYGLDWQKLKTKQWISPIKRPIVSNTDTQYFVPCGDEHNQDPPDETSGWDIDF